MGRGRGPGRPWASAQTPPLSLGQDERGSWNRIHLGCIWICQGGDCGQFPPRLSFLICEVGLILERALEDCDEAALCTVHSRAQHGLGPVPCCARPGPAPAAPLPTEIETQSSRSPVSLRSLPPISCRTSPWDADFRSGRSANTHELGEEPPQGTLVPVPR